VYTGQYPLMGNAQVMTAKAAWDNACYWAVTALLYFQRRLAQPEFMATIDPLMKRFFVLHARMQVFFRIWDQRDAARYDAGFTNVVAVEELRRLQAALGGPALSDVALRATLQANLDLLERFAQSLQVLASEVDPALGHFVAPVGADEAPFDIRAITLNRVPVAGPVPAV
jgi:hypothetical protein